MSRETIFLFDLDGTITKQELLPLIAKAAGFEKEITILTNETILGKIPFEESIKLRVNLLKNIELDVVHSVVKKVVLESNFVEFIRENIDCCAIVTGNLDVWINPLIKMHQWKVYSSIAKIKNGKLHGIDLILDKKEVLKKYTGKFVVSIGDGMNDYYLLKNSDIGIVYGNPKMIPTELYNVADYYSQDSETICRLLRQLL